MQDKRLKHTRYCPLATIQYKDAIFQCGRVKNSPHKNNRFYLKIVDGDYLHLTEDELLAISTIINKSLWNESIMKRSKIKTEKKDWKTIGEI